MVGGLVDKYQRFGGSSYIVGVQNISGQAPPTPVIVGLFAGRPCYAQVTNGGLVRAIQPGGLRVRDPSATLTFSVLAHCCDVGGTWFLRITGTYATSPTCTTSHSERSVMRNSRLQIRSEDSQVKTQLVLWIFILF
jgi:hypothetical protein